MRVCVWGGEGRMQGGGRGEEGDARVGWAGGRVGVRRGGIDEDEQKEREGGTEGAAAGVPRAAHAACGPRGRLHAPERVVSVARHCDERVRRFCYTCVCVVAASESAPETRFFIQPGVRMHVYRSVHSDAEDQVVVAVEVATVWECWRGVVWWM